MKFHDELNPKLWETTEEGYNLKDEIVDKLEEIAEAFIDYLNIPDEAILDIRITGSSANYNYTKHSDLDLHLIVDYEKVHEECPIVEGYLWSMKSAFNKEHDISIYGIDVEVYAEDSRQQAVSNGVYSLLNDEWIRKPEKIEPTNNDAAVLAKYNEIKDAVEKLNDSEEAELLLDKIYEMRKAGLTEQGEFSTENLAFKMLRNEGYIDMLKKIKKEKIDKQLTLESFETLDRYKLINIDDYNKAIKAIDDIINSRESISKTEYGQLARAIARTEKEAQSGAFTINIERVRDKAKMQRSQILKLYKNRKNEAYESIKEEFFYGNDKYIIVPVSYAYNDIRILDKKTGEFLKNENGDILKFSTEEECGNYIKSLDESIKESLQSEYKQAFDLLIEGENIVSTLDTDFGRQFVKDVESLYEIKSSKLKLRKAKELLKDIQGYLVDEQYDGYNAKITKFMNNSKNESIKEDKQLSLESYNESQYNPEEFEKLKATFNNVLIPTWNNTWHNKFISLLQNYGYQIITNNKIDEFRKRGVLIQTDVKQDIIPNMVKLYTDNGFIFNTFLDNRPTFMPNSVSVLFGIYTKYRNATFNILGDTHYEKELGSFGPILNGKGYKSANDARQVDIDVTSLKYMDEEQIKTKFENGLQFMYKYLEACLQQIKDKTIKNESIKEYYEEDDYEDTAEMHKEKYVTYFETQEGRQKYTIYHVYTDSTDDSYNELCDKSDNQLGMYSSYKELKDALKERAEKIAKQQGWTVKSIENLGEDDEYYRERNKWESMKDSLEDELIKEANKITGRGMFYIPVRRLAAKLMDKVKGASSEEALKVARMFFRESKNESISYLKNLQRFLETTINKCL